VFCTCSRLNCLAGVESEFAISTSCRRARNALADPFSNSSEKPSSLDLPAHPADRAILPRRLESSRFTDMARSTWRACSRSAGVSRLRLLLREGGFRAAD